MCEKSFIITECSPHPVENGIEIVLPFILLKTNICFIGDSEELPIYLFFLQVIIKNYLGFVKVGWANLLLKPTRECPTSVFVRQAPLYVTLSPAILSKLGQKNRKSAAKGPNWMGGLSFSLSSSHSIV